MNCLNLTLQIYFGLVKESVLILPYFSFFLKKYLSNGGLMGLGDRPRPGPLHISSFHGSTLELGATQPVRLNVPLVEAAFWGTFIIINDETVQWG